MEHRIGRRMLAVLLLSLVLVCVTGTSAFAASSVQLDGGGDLCF